MNHKKLFTSFFNGILTTLVATPCTAPFMGTAIAVALSQSSIDAFFIFSGLSLGLAFPFLVLCLFPEALKFLPKPGTWMKTFKEILAFPLMGAVVWLLWVLESIKPTSVIDVLIALLVIVFLLWIYGCIQVTNKKIVSFKTIPLLILFCLLFYREKSVLMEKIFVGFIILGCLISLYVFIQNIKNNTPKKTIHYACEIIIAACCSVAFIPMLQTFDNSKTLIESVNFSNDIVEKALKDGRPVFINYTARWCITCQINKINVLSNDIIKKALKDYDVLYVEADWTNHSAQITESLKSHNRESIPLYVLKIPGKKKPIIFSELLTTKDILDALTKISSPHE